MSSSKKGRARAAAWRRANPEKSRAASAAWKRNNPEKTKAVSRATAKRWRERNPKKHARAVAEWRRKNPKRTIFITKKWRAKKAGVEFRLKFADVQWPAKCPLLGIPLVYERGRGRPNNSSFDRLDPTKGYVPGNVWIISRRANTIKSDATPAELRAIADGVEKRLAEYAGA